jgi:hypothetical protein
MERIEGRICQLIDCLLARHAWLPQFIWSGL